MVVVDREGWCGHVKGWLWRYCEREGSPSTFIVVVVADYVVVVVNPPPP